jgi:Two component regulator propeller
LSRISCHPWQPPRAEIKKGKMIKFAKSMLSVLMIGFYSLCNAQNKTEPSRGNANFGTKDTVTSHGPNLVTRTVLQDRKGNIWSSSFGGVFRYDGKSFTNVTSKASSARFFSVLEDRKGNLWLGSIGSGVLQGVV